MAIYDILCGVKDIREQDGGICRFNGYLEDYLSILEDQEDKSAEYEILQRLFEEDQNLHVCVNLHLNINKDAIANQIIRYKDSFKLPKGSICCPYIVYGKADDAQKAMIITMGDSKAYILAKALYYVISEPENEYEGTRNEIIAVSACEHNINVVLDVFDAFFHRLRKAGIVQRDLDAKMFTSYAEMYELAKQMGLTQQEQIETMLEETDDKEQCINGIIALWFLLKKFSYVQYMMDKSTLHAEHEGNVKKQRQVAKEKCDAISFRSYSEMWSMVRRMHA